MEDASRIESLPRDHELRNKPLIDIGAEYRYRGTERWTKLLPTFKIAKNCFNDLGPAWTDSLEWRATAAG